MAVIELSVLGLALRGSDNLRLVLSAGVRAVHFRDPGLRRIFEAALASEEAGEGVSLESVAPRVPDQVERVLDAVEKAPLTQNVSYWCQELLDRDFALNTSNRLSELASKLSARNPFDPIKSIRDEIRAIERDLSARDVTTPDIRDVMLRTIDNIEDAIKGRRKSIPSGLDIIDHRMGGLFPGALLILGARTSVGKTTLGTQWALHAAQQGVKTAYFTIEMTSEEIAQKFITTLTGISSSRLRSGVLSEGQLDQITEAVRQIASYPLSVNDKAACVIADLEIEAKLLKGQGKLEFMVVDYVQLMKSEGRWSNRSMELNDISNRLKILAKDLQIGVVALVQINREASKTSGPPGLHHIKDCGSIEQDADAVLMIHRDGELGDSNARYWLNIEKNRHGKVGHFEMSADLSVNRFKNKMGGYGYDPG